MLAQRVSEAVFPEDVETIRRDLEHGCKQLQGYRYQIVLRELQTSSGHPTARSPLGKVQSSRLSVVRDLEFPSRVRGSIAPDRLVQLPVGLPTDLLS